MKQIKFTKVERRIACFDDGKSGDRYTVVFLGFKESKPRTFQALGMSGFPFHPQGIGQHCGAMLGRHLGRRVRFSDLPGDCQKLVRQDLNGAEPIDTKKP